jgi:hypothetical protein
LLGDTGIDVIAVAIATPVQTQIELVVAAFTSKAFDSAQMWCAVAMPTFLAMTTDLHPVLLRCDVARAVRCSPEPRVNLSIEARLHDRRVFGHRRHAYPGVHGEAE